MEGGFWKTDQNFDPILRLKNVLLKQPLDVTPFLYFADGTKFQLPVVTLEPAAVAQVNIRIALQSVPASIRNHMSSYGMAGISYRWSWPAVIATIQNTDEIASLTITSSLRSDVRTVHATPEVSNPQVTRGQWWLPTANADGYVVLENTSLHPRQASVQISGHAGNALATQQVSLPSHATALIRLSTALANARSAETAGGVEIRYTGPARGLLAYAGIEDLSVGYSASPILVEDHLDPDRPVHEVTLSAPGLLLGNADPAMLFPSGTYFKPYALLHNISAKPLQVSLSLVSPGDGETSQTRSLGQVSLLPGQVSQFDFDSHFNSSSPLPDGYGHLTASFEGRDGDLQMSTGSADQSQTYVFEVNASQQADSASRTLCFWSVEGDNDSMITVWNYKATAQDLVLTLYYSGGHYKIPIHLAARQSYNLDMMSLVRSRIPDPDGTLIPSNITNGSGILSGAGGETDKISVALAASVFNVRNATCGGACTTCNGATAFGFDPDPYAIPVAGTEQTTTQATWNTGSAYANPSGTWMTSSSSIATVNSSGMISGKGPGSATITSLLSNYPVYAEVCSDDDATPCPDADLEGQAPANVTPTVTFSPLTAVAAGGTVSVAATFSGGATSSPYPIAIYISTAAGTTGSATLTGGVTNISISAPTTLTVTGVTVSSAPNNLLLNAITSGPEGSGGQEDATNPQSFSVVAIPVNFAFYSANNLPNGTIQFSYTWQSSSGNISDISSCIVGEDVSYPGSSPTYQWPAPMVASTTNPTIVNVQGNNSIGTNSTTTAGMGDLQSAPSSYTKPYQSASFQATQIYQWACPNYNDGGFYRFTPNITITRSVSQNSSGQWIYQFTKSGFTSTYTNSAVLP